MRINCKILFQKCVLSITDDYSFVVLQPSYNESSNRVSGIFSFFPPSVIIVLLVFPEYCSRSIIRSVPSVAENGFHYSAVSLLLYDCKLVKIKQSPNLNPHFDIRSSPQCGISYIDMSTAIKFLFQTDIEGITQISSAEKYYIEILIRVSWFYSLSIVRLEKQESKLIEVHTIRSKAVVWSRFWFQRMFSIYFNTYTKKKKHLYSWD